MKSIAGSEKEVPVFILSSARRAFGWGAWTVWRRSLAQLRSRLNIVKILTGYTVQVEFSGKQRNRDDLVAH